MSKKLKFFQKGWTIVLVRNCPFFHFFILGLVGQENVFYSREKYVYDILEPKKAFLGYKNKKFKKSKYWAFSKGVSPWFWSKIGHFSIVLI